MAVVRFGEVGRVAVFFLQNGISDEERLNDVTVDLRSAQVLQRVGIEITVTLHAEQQLAVAQLLLVLAQGIVNHIQRILVVVIVGIQDVDTILVPEVGALLSACIFLRCARLPGKQESGEQGNLKFVHPLYCFFVFQTITQLNQENPK